MTLVTFVRCSALLAVGALLGSAATLVFDPRADHAGDAVPADAGNVALATATCPSNAPNDEAALLASAEREDRRNAIEIPPRAEPEAEADLSEIADTLLDLPGGRRAGFAMLAETDPRAALDILHSLHERAGASDRGARAVAAALRMLGRSPYTGLDTELYAYLESPSELVQYTTRQVLERRGDTRPMGDWVAAHGAELHSDAPTVRAKAVSSLGRSRSRTAVPEILPLLADPDLTVRMAAIVALGRTGGPGEIPILESIIPGATPTTQRIATRALANLRDRAEEPIRTSPGP